MPKQSENQFLVNLDGLKLTDEQRQRINSGIQSVVMKEIAQIDQVEDFSVTKITKPFSFTSPFINGIIWDKLRNSIQLNYLKNVASRPQ